MASGVGVILFSLSFGCQIFGSPCGSFGPCLRSSAVIVRCSPLQEGQSDSPNKIGVAGCARGGGGGGLTGGLVVYSRVSPDPPGTNPLDLHQIEPGFLL